jgi:hypothetical protein
MIETVVDDLGKVDPKASHFVEPDGLRLVHKVWKKGVLTSRRFLRATALPVGEYVASGSHVIHRYDPATVIVELRQHQAKQRARTREFAAVAKAVAKAAGGRITKPAHDEWVDYRIAVPAKKTVRVQELQKRFGDNAAFVIPLSLNDDPTRSYPQELGVVCADSYVDVLARWRGLHERALFELVDNACTITGIEKMWSFRSVTLQLDHPPKNAKAISDAIFAEGADGEGEASATDYKKMLANKQLHLWWDS